MLTDAVRRFQTGGSHTEVPWVAVGLAIPAVQIAVLVIALTIL
jgi:hypothetical protein